MSRDLTESFQRSREANRRRITVDAVPPWQQQLLRLDEDVTAYIDVKCADL